MMRKYERPEMIVFKMEIPVTLCNVISQEDGVNWNEQ